MCIKKKNYPCFYVSACTVNILKNIYIYCDRCCHFIDFRPKPTKFLHVFSTTLIIIIIRVKWTWWRRGYKRWFACGSNVRGQGDKSNSGERSFKLRKMQIEPENFENLDSAAIVIDRQRPFKCTKQKNDIKINRFLMFHGANASDKLYWLFCEYPYDIYEFFLCLRNKKKKKTKMASKALPIIIKQVQPARRQSSSTKGRDFQKVFYLMHRFLNN